MLELTQEMMEIQKLPYKEFSELLESAQTRMDKEALIIARGATDLDFYATCFFPHYCEFKWNDYHEDYFSEFVYGERKVRRATAAPRGSAKSTMETLIKTCHDACYGLEKFILILSSTAPLSHKKLKDIRNEVQTNDFLRRVYNLRFNKKKASETEFLLHSEFGSTYFAALGRGAEVRGIRHNQNRPSKIVLDDVEFSEEVYNEKSRRKTEDWFNEDVVKCGDNRTSINFVGTVLHKDSLLSKLLYNPSYLVRKYKSVISWSQREDLWNKWRDIYTSIDNQNRKKDALEFYNQNKDEMLKGTQVLWPEKESYYDHMIDLIEIGRRSFFKEKQNEPLGSEEPVFEKIHYYKEVNEGFQIESSGQIVRWDELKHSCFAAIDPSTGKTKASKGQLGDFTVILVGYKDSKGRVFCHYDFTKRVSPSRYIAEIFEMHDRFNFERFGVETNLYRNLLLPNIIEEKKRRDQAAKKSSRIAFYDIEQTENKRERITRLEPKCNHGWMLFNRALSREFMSQVEDFPHADHDDAPDCLEMLWNMAHNRYKPSGSSIDAMAGR